MWRKLYSVLIVLSISLICGAKDNRFKHLTTEDGISQSEVYTFLEDHNGFLWVGTVYGLNRYDGYSFEIFNTDNSIPNTLSNSTVRCLAEDKMGRIWIGTDDGLNFYDQKRELIFKVKINTSIDKFSVWAILIQDNHVFIGTNDGLWSGSIKNFNLKDIEKSFKKLNKFQENNSKGLVRAVKPSRRGGIWVLADRKISRISFRNNKIESPIIEDAIVKDFKSFFDFIEDPAGCIWIVDKENKILRYNPKNKIVENLTNVNGFLKKYAGKYRTLSIDHYQRIWVGTIDKGLLCITYDYQKGKIKNVESIQNEQNNSTGLNSNLVFTTYVSKTNKLWVGTIGSGVNMLDLEAKKIKYYSLKSQNSELTNVNFIRAVMVDKQNRILAGTHNNGLYLIDRETKKSIKLGFDTEPVYYISEYRDNLYFVCSSKGIFLVEIKGISCKILSSYKTTNSVFYITHGRGDIYWCAALQGLLKIRINNNRIEIDGEYNKSTKPSLSTNICRVLYFDDPTNQLIVGTQGGGVNFIKLDKQSNPLEIRAYKLRKKVNSLSNNYVRSIVKDKNNIFWIGTYEGLNKVLYNSETGDHAFKAYKRKNGLPNNMISSIVEDDKNNLWLGTNNGLSKFSPATERFMNYNMDDGFQSNEFSEHTAFKTKDGEIVMGGINGISAFYPEDITESKLKPRTLITDFFLNNQRINSGQEIDGYVPLEKSIIYTEKLELLPIHKNIGFKFSALIYPNAGKVKYAYMLQGFDKQWKYTEAANRIANYTNLSHGKYVFKVKATNTDGIWENNPVAISIHIKTPFYLTWFAIALYVIAFVLIVVYFSYHTVIKLSTQKNLILEKEHNTKLMSLDEMRQRFFVNISHDLRTPLTLISGPLDQILNGKENKVNLNENLQLIKRNVQRLTDLVEQLLDFRKSEVSNLTPKLELVDFIEFSNNEISHFTFAAQNKGLKLTMEILEEQIMVECDPRMISKVYFNILSNAIKYTSNGTINIRIQRVNGELSKLTGTSSIGQYIQVEICDNGIGITKEQEKLIFERFYQANPQNGNGYGIGLFHAKELVECHKGIIEAESNPDGGTIIRFFIQDKAQESLQNHNDAFSVKEYGLIDNADAIKVNDEASDATFKNILIVDDISDMLVYIKNGLKNNYNVFTATNGLDGLKMASDIMPDLIVSDVMMPNMDGMAFCEAIKTNIVTSHIPVILLTAKIDLKTKYEGIETGADDFITKPFEMEYLLIRINNLLQSRENLRKIFQRSLVLEPTNKVVTSVDEKFLSKLMEYIDENMSNEDFTINMVESKFGLSHSTFYRKIKTLTGQSGQEFILNFRLKRAHQILSENKNLRVSDVAYMVGILNLSYFTKCFKEYFGFPPSEMKNK